VINRPYLYFSDTPNGHIKRALADLKDNQLPVTFIENIFPVTDAEINDLVYDRLNNNIIWTDSDSGEVNKASADNGNNFQILASGQPNVRGVAVHQASGLIFFTVKSVNDIIFIKSMKLDGTNLTTILDSTNDGLTDPNNIVVDVLNNKIIWTEPSIRKIFTANLDGTAKTQILAEGPSSSTIIGLAIDTNINKLYYTTLVFNGIVIKNANLDGSNKSTVKTITGSQLLNLKIDSFRRNLYITVGSSNSIKKMNLDTTTVIDYFNLPTNLLRATTLVGDDFIRTQNISLFINGLQTSQTNISLFLQNRQLTTNISLFLKTNKTLNISVPIFLKGPQTIITQTPLFIKGQNTSQTNIPLFLQSRQLTTNISIFIKGPQLTTTNISLFIERPQLTDFDSRIFWGNNNNGDVYVVPDTISPGQTAKNRTDIQNIIPSGDPLSDKSTSFYYNNTTNRLFWIDDQVGQILTNDSQGSSFSVIKSSLGTGIRDLTIHEASGHIYFTNIDSDSITRMNLDGSNLQIVATGVVNAWGITLDEISDTLFWTELNNGKIVSSGINSGFSTIIKTGLAFPIGIEVDGINDRLYWSEFTGQTINRTNLNGTLPTEVVFSGGVGLTAIAIDINNQKLYFADQNTPKKIRKTTLDIIGQNDVTIDWVAEETGTIDGVFGIAFKIFGGVITSNTSLFISFKQSTTINTVLFINGQDIVKTNTPLFISGFKILQTDSSLFISGFDTLQTNTSLFINGRETSQDNISLFITASDILLNNILLFVNGLDISKTDTSLFINGLDISKINTSLFINGFEVSQDIISLFINGFNVSKTNTSLFINGFEVSKTNTSLFINGNDTKQTNTTLFISASDTKQANTILFISPSDISQINISLFINGFEVSKNNIPLFINGFEVSQDIISLFMNGLDTRQTNTSLFISGEDNLQSDISLFVKGNDISFNDISLFINGKIIIQINTDISLFIKVSQFRTEHISLFLKVETEITSNTSLFLKVISEITSNTILSIHGSPIPLDTSCPALDPTASIQISSNLVDIFQDNIDALINQLGKNVILEFTPNRTACINCINDPVSDRSTGIFIQGGPRPFARGQQCPWCKGRGFLLTPVTECIKGLIKWQPRDAQKYGISLSDFQGIVRLKTFLKFGDDIIRAQSAIMDNDIIGQLKMRVKLIRGPYGIGLRESRYIVTFWELVRGSLI